MEINWKDDRACTRVNISAKTPSASIPVDERNTQYLLIVNNLLTHRKLVFGVYVPEPLYVVEHEPRQRYDHQHDERYAHEQHGSPGGKKSKLNLKQTDSHYVLQSQCGRVIMFHTHWNNFF